MYFAIFLAIILSFFLSKYLIPFLNKFGYKFKLLDFPNKRKQHKKPIVRIGGIAIFLSFLISNVIIFFLLQKNINIVILISFLICSFCFFILGLFEDIFKFSPYTRLSIEFILVIIFWFNNLKIEDLVLNPFIEQSSLNLLPLFSLVLTSFWIVGIVNSINWIDGLDGLAAGTSAISLIGFIVVSLNFNQNEAAIISACLLGSCLGFLKYNFFPAKILMGDSGSYFIGSVLALLGLKSFFVENNFYITQQNQMSPVNFYIPLFILFLPVLDMVCVIFKRSLNSKSPFFPDRNHFHHKLLLRGYSHRDSVLIMYLITQWVVSISILFLDIKYKFIVFIVSSFLLFFLTTKFKKNDIEI